MLGTNRPTGELTDSTRCTVAFSHYGQPAEMSMSTFALLAARRCVLMFTVSPANLIILTYIEPTV